MTDERRGVDPWMRDKVEEINERTIRLEERIVTLFKRMEDHSDTCASGSAEHGAMKAEVTALGVRVEAVEALKKSLGQKAWEVLILIGGAVAAAWATMRIGEHK